MYFGTVFLKETLWGYLTGVNSLRHNINSTNKLPTACVLHLARLKLANLLDSQEQGRFHKLHANSVYVYEYTKYTECSAVKLSQIIVWCIGEVEENKLSIWY